MAKNMALREKVFAAQPMIHIVHRPYTGRCEQSPGKPARMNAIWGEIMKTLFHRNSYNEGGNIINKDCASWFM